MVTKKKEKTGAGTEGGEGEGGSHSQYQSPHRFDTQVLESGILLSIFCERSKACKFGCTRRLLLYLRRLWPAAQEAQQA